MEKKLKADFQSFSLIPEGSKIQILLEQNQAGNSSSEGGMCSIKYA